MGRELDGRARRRALVALILGAVLVALAVPQVPAGLHRDAAEGALRAAAAAGELGAALDSADADTAAAKRWHARPADDRRHALIAQVRGDRAAAVAQLRRALRRQPADPVAWTRLAVLHHAEHRPRACVRALAMAVRTGPASRHLAAVRGELILRHWDALHTRVGLPALGMQLRLAVAEQPALIETVAARVGRSRLLLMARTEAWAS